jgi:hypothetical protein
MVEICLKKIRQTNLSKGIRMHTLLEICILPAEMGKKSAGNLFPQVKPHENPWEIIFRR